MDDDEHTMQVISAKVEPELRAALMRLAKEQERPLSTVIRRCLRWALEQYGLGNLEPLLRR